MSHPGASTDTIDLADIARALRRGWRWIAAGILGGAIIAALILVLAPRRFDGTATAIIRASPEGGGSLLSRLGDGGGAAALLGGSASSPIETDIQILSSNTVVGKVVDSLALQVEVRAPAMPATTIVRAVSLPGSFAPIDLVVSRSEQGGHRYETRNAAGLVPPNGTIALPPGTVTLVGALPDKVKLRLSDREDAVRRTAKNLSVSKAGGEVVRVSYRAADSLSAARVPNAVLIEYLGRRKTDDRGVNAHRAEFLTLQVDSTARLQSTAEEALRAFQERSGLVDAQVIGKLELESVADLRKNLGALEVEEGALDQLLGQVASGRVTPRQLVAYPSFLKSPGINDLLRQMAELETERSKLLERRLETDDQVVALTRSIANIESQLVPLARAYSGALARQRADLSSQIAGVTATLTSFPGAAQTSARLVREVVRLNQLSLALQAQLVQARLAAISEGGDVRALDQAIPPKKPAFPSPLLTFGLGVGVGLVAGLVAALVSQSHGRYLDGPQAIERVFGVPTVRFLPGVPLLMSGREVARTLLLIPLDAATPTEAVAAVLADTALARGGRATILDFTGSAPVARDGASEMITRAESESSFVVVRLGGLSTVSTAAILSHDRPVLVVASAGRVRRSALEACLETLRRLDVPCAGVVLAENHTRALSAV